MKGFRSYSFFLVAPQHFPRFFKVFFSLLPLLYGHLSPNLHIPPSPPPLQPPLPKPTYSSFSLLYSHLSPNLNIPPSPSFTATSLQTYILLLLPSFTDTSYQTSIFLLPRPLRPPLPKPTLTKIRLK